MVLFDRKHETVEMTKRLRLTKSKAQHKSNIDDKCEQKQMLKLTYEQSYNE